MELTFSYDQGLYRLNFTCPFALYFFDWTTRANFSPLLHGDAHVDLDELTIDRIGDILIFSSMAQTGAGFSLTLSFQQCRDSLERICREIELIQEHIALDSEDEYFPSDTEGEDTEGEDTEDEDTEGEDTEGEDEKDNMEEG